MQVFIRLFWSHDILFCELDYFKRVVYFQMTSWIMLIWCDDCLFSNDFGLLWWSFIFKRLCVIIWCDEFFFNFWLSWSLIFKYIGLMWLSLIFKWICTTLIKCDDNLFSDDFVIQCDGYLFSNNHKLWWFCLFSINFILWSDVVTIYFQTNLDCDGRFDPKWSQIVMVILFNRWLYHFHMM